jgi:hypothetical protein
MSKEIPDVTDENLQRKISDFQYVPASSGSVHLRLTRQSILLVHEKMITLCITVIGTSDQRQFSKLADQLRKTLNARIESLLDAAQRAAIANHLPYAQPSPNYAGMSASRNA